MTLRMVLRSSKTVKMLKFKQKVLKHRKKSTLIADLETCLKRNADGNQ